jgi:peptide/nickel transport system substrate-binding protein
MIRHWIARSLSVTRMIVVGAALIVLLVSCTANTPETPTQPASTPPPFQPAVTVIRGTEAPPVTAAPQTAAPPAAGGAKNAVLAFIQDFDTLNPMYAQALSSIYTQPLWNCRPWNFDDQNNPIPLLVEELPTLENGGISADGKVITLKLRDDITWSDGQPITSQDFVFTHQMITDSKNGVSVISPYDQVESVTAPDERSVTVTFKAPYAAWVSALWRYLLPAHVLQPVYEQDGSLQNAAWNRAPTVGCGPFVFQSWEAGQSARFTANQNYWMGKPKLDEIQVRFLADENAKAEALKSGQADLSVFLLNAGLYVPELQKANVSILPVDAGYHEGMFFFMDPTNGNPALQDARVRQAIAYAINREQMAKDLTGNISQPIASYWDNTPYIDPSIQPWPYDPEKAKKLLDEAGWVDSNGNGTRDKDGDELVFTYGTTTSTVRQSVQRSVQAMLAEVGIRLDLFNYDSGVFFQGYNQGGPAATGQLDLFEYAARTKNYPDPSTNDFLCSQIPTNDELGENWSWLCDQELDGQLQQQLTQIDFGQRQKTLQAISKRIYDQVYFLGFWSDPDIWAANARLQNVRLSGITPLFNAAEWDISQ